MNILKAETLTGSQYSACILGLVYILQDHRNIAGPVFKDLVKQSQPIFTDKPEQVTVQFSKIRIVAFRLNHIIKQ